MELTFLSVLISAILLSSTTFLLWINWKILLISQKILHVSEELLKETIIIRVETIKIRQVSEQVYLETKKLRENIGEPIEEIKKPSDTKKRKTYAVREGQAKPPSSF